MKINMPITQHEQVMADDEIIVSKTDLQGRITYVNDCFLRMSGFTEDELIGKPHNLVRHPDMPESAFQNLWDTLNAKEPWTGMVKNRCKNGDFYWVQANVAPMIEKGEVTGYLSVRTKPTAENIKAAAELYAAINAGEATLGAVSFWQKLNVLKRMKIWQQIVALVALTMVMFGGAWFSALSALDEAHDGLEMANNDRVTALTAIKSDTLIQFEQTLLLKTLVQQSQAPFEENAEILQNDIEALQENTAVIRSSNLGEGERMVADVFVSEVEKYIAEVLQPAVGLLENKDLDALQALVQEKIIGVDFVEASQALLALEVELDSVSAEEFEASIAKTEQVHALSLALIIFSTLVGLFMAWNVIRTLSSRLKYAHQMLDRVSEGEYFDWVEVDQKDEVGVMLMALKSMQIRQGYLVTEITLQVTAALRIKQALDKVGSNVMISDADYNVFYMNESLEAMLRSNEQAFRKDLPDFRVDDVIGSNIDTFHQDLAHQRSILDGLTSAYMSEDLDIGGRWIRITATPVFDESGKRIATTAEWEDRTSQIHAEQEVENFVAAAGAGDFANRMPEAGKEGFLLRLAQSLNGLSGTLESGFADVDAALKALEAGDLNHRITNAYEGTYDAIKQSANNTAEKLNNIINIEIAPVWDAAKRGDFTRRVAMAGKQGFYAELAASTNDLNDTLGRGFDDVGMALQALEDGKLTHRITNDYEGTFDTIKQAANNTSEKLAELMGSVRNTANNVAEGASEISDGSSTLSDRTQEQAAALEETSASVEELTSTVHQNADNARQANQLAVGAKEQAEQGVNVVNQAIEAMSGISHSSKKIADIIGVIDEIAFQTNLLALNAAVEAARAGEQGRGFAVVAAEVRTLAQRSAEAAKEISDLIKASVESVSEGSKLVDNSGTALTEIVGSVQKVSDIIAEIAAASQEQASGVELINKSITQMDSATQQNAALVEETAASSLNLDNDAVDLMGLVSEFDLGDAGNGRQRR